MKENDYRQSRLCRLLGNPIAFAIVQALAESKEMSPSEIAKALRRSVSRVSHVLSALRLAEVVRYETDGRRATYRLKHPRETRQVLGALSEFIASASSSR
ncbi:MAG TPA: metalloregulator ArsR/SmtB family transcription factor [Candidatus Binatia bacterium]|nr:metalloregulator ArsR/SmtB family transcription factor [Candidatus Binatia bacterium]